MIIKMRIKKLMQETGISLEELEKRTGINKQYLKTIQDLPADEILLHEAVLIAEGLGKDLKDLYTVESTKNK